MGYLSFKARPLTVLEGSANALYSDVFDIQDTVAFFGLLKVTAATASLTVYWEFSIDGHHWEAGSNFDAKAAAGLDSQSVTTAADIKGRYLRFRYSLAATYYATFEIDVFCRTYS